jgi:glutamate 5-kinase
MSKGKKAVITLKIGSNVIANAEGLPNEQVIANISRQIKGLRQRGHSVILVSSGAVAAGRSIYQFPKKTDTVVQRQVLASLGQVKLISLYKEAFDKEGMLCAQVLVTKDDFKSRHHYLNMQNCLSALLSHDIVPILNENDVVSITELMFTDNDELAGLVSAMMNTNLLIILTNVDGVFDGDPSQPGTKIIHEYDPKLIRIQEIATGKKSGFGRGGILTKCQTSEKIAGIGIPVHIANGKVEDVTLRIIDGEQIGTRFPAKRLASSFKKYMAHAYEEAKGRVMINEGAKNVLHSDKAHSLLPVGITQVIGKFKKGDLVKIIDENQREIGLGLARYGYKKAKQVVGLKNQTALIHYDHLYLH